MKTISDTGRAYDHLLCADTGVDRQNGRLCPEAGKACNYDPIVVNAGDHIRIKTEGVRYRLFRYGTEPEKRWIEEYEYAPEGNWFPFLENQDQTWYDSELIADESAYCRFVLQGVEGCTFLEDVVEFSRVKRTEKKEWISREVQHLTDRIDREKLPKGLSFVLLSDTHYAIGGNWKDTFQSIKEAKDRLNPAGIIHLGDLTDGMYPLNVTKSFASRVLTDLRSLRRPLYLCLGNHDANYFRGNTEQLSKKEQAAFYQRRRKPYYYQDFRKQRIRLVFLDSFDPERKQRYGFSLQQYLWLRRILRRTKRSWHILVFSHVTPVAKLHVWSDDILRGEKMLRLLAQRKEQVLGWIHGHSHADQVYLQTPFPVIGIGCGKQESFQEHKPEGSVTYPRKADTPEQELWDVLYLPEDGSKLFFFRYGAGKDRIIERKEDGQWRAGN